MNKCQYSENDCLSIKVSPFIIKPKVVFAQAPQKTPSNPSPKTAYPASPPKLPPTATGQHTKQSATWGLCCLPK
jgi:hypothetical protein